MTISKKTTLYSLCSLLIALILPIAAPAQDAQRETSLTEQPRQYNDVSRDASRAQDHDTLRMQDRDSSRVQDRYALPDETSAYEAFVSTFNGPRITQFGYDFFSRAPSTFAPADNVPVTEDYLIAPGDELRLSIWGRVEDHWTLEVNRDGTIDVPKVGRISVAGVAFKDLKDALTREIGRYYTSFTLNVSMGALRSIRVYVVGAARVPGAYTVSSLSTMVNALFEAGGPAKNGSMRTIQLKRGGRLITTLDLYDLLLKGDKSADARLVNEDVIFIPPVGGLAGISGDIKNPAIYELRADEKLTDLISMAGGFATTAFRGRVAMRRIVDHRFRDFFDGDLAEVASDSLKNLALRDGDLVSVMAVIEKDSAVNVAGAVTYPGKFGIDKGRTTLAGVITLAGGLLDQASDDAEITRVRLSTAGVETTRFEANLSGLRNGMDKTPLLLEPNDHIMVKPVSDWRLYTMIEVSGEVNHPGTYTVKKGETLSSVLERAGGFTDKAYPRGAVFLRESTRVQQEKNLQEIAQRMERQLLLESSAKMQTALSAEEAAASRTEMDSREKFVAALKDVKAQGRVHIVLKSIKSLRGSDYDIELEDKDSITIPSKSSVVTVSGAVMSQGSYVYSSSRYGSYINMAGGYSEYSKPGKTFILKADGSAGRARKFLFFSAKVEPGDTVVVPERFDRIAWLREIRDISQILMNVALTAGVVIKVL